MKTTSTILVCDGLSGVPSTLAYIKATYGNNVNYRVWVYDAKEGDIIAISFVKFPRASIPMARPSPRAASSAT